MLATLTFSTIQCTQILYWSKKTPCWHAWWVQLEFISYLYQISLLCTHARTQYRSYLSLCERCSVFWFQLSFCSTFFKEFHGALIRTIKSLLKEEGPSEAILFSPRRGDSLDKFLREVKDSGLHFSTDEMYDTEVWRRHQGYVEGDDSWPNYEMDHCYPLLVRITRWRFRVQVYCVQYAYFVHINLSRLSSDPIYYKIWTDSTMDK